MFSNIKNILSIPITASLKFAVWFIFFGLMIFAPAGSISFLNGWIIILINMIVIYYGVIFMNRDRPDIIEKRLKLGEIKIEQRLYVRITASTFFLMFILSGLDQRFHWTRVTVLLQITAFILVIIGQVIFIMTINQNRFASRIIEIQEKQMVIDTGLYSIVRHPMYSSSIFIYFFSPLALNSFIALIPMCIFPFMLNYRMKFEEKLLLEELDGYEDYLAKVKYRVIPFIW